jgi:murein DD-endopeptidase MepM/ murein hydrolase activator NlpD
MLLLAWFALNLKHGPLPPEPVQPVTPSADGRFAFPDAARVVAPYAVDYTITQGVHGQSYGHMAVDLAVGRGTAVTSPINGRVTALYTDEYGNPTLVIENQRYTVTLLHGDYTVSLNDEVTIGQTVGTESNNGYTMDMVGNLCYGAAYCGNHTHFNLYDKELGANVNPLQVMEP